MCTRCFYCFQVAVPPAENNPRNTFLKALFLMFSILSAYMKLCTFLLNVERDELVLGGVKLLLSRIVLTPLSVWHEKYLVY